MDTGCLAMILVVLGPIVGIISIFMGDLTQAGILFLASIFAFAYLYFRIKSENKKDNENYSWIREARKDNNIDDYKVEFTLQNALVQYPDKQLLYTKDKRLFLLEMHKGVKQIELKDILNIEVECTTMERNRQRIVALTTTFDSIKSIVGLKVKIITGRDVYNVELDTNPATIDKAKQCQLILERDLKALNQ